MKRESPFTALLVTLMMTSVAANNVLTGSSLVIATDNTDYPWSYSYDQSSTLAKTIVDDDILSDFSQEGECSATTRAGSTITVTMTMPSLVEFRSIVLLLTPTTLKDAFFQSYDYRAFNGANEVATHLGLTTNTVIYDDAVLIQADSIRISMLVQDGTQKLCADSLIATKAHYLNEYSEYNTFKVQYAELVNTKTYVDSTVSPFHPEWLSTDCSMSSDQSLEPAFQNDSYMQLFNLDEPVLQDTNKTVFISQVLVQFGDQQRFGGQISVSATGNVWNPVTETYSFIYDHKTLGSGYTSSFNVYASPPVETSQLRLKSSSTLQEICSFQTFGYKTCSFEFTQSTYELYVPIGTTETVTTSGSIDFLHLVGHDPSTDQAETKEFCRHGFTYSHSYASSADPSVTLDIDIDSNTVALTTDSTITATEMTSTLTIELSDTRDPSGVAGTIVVTIIYKHACTENDLLDNQAVYLLANGGSLKTVTHRAYQGETDYLFLVSLLPTCAGFQDSMTLAGLSLTTESGFKISAQNSLSSAVYDSCLTDSGRQLCGLIDYPTKTISFEIRGEFANGVNSIALSLVFEGYDGLSATSTVQREQTLQDTYNFIVYSCLGTEFNQVIDLATSLDAETVYEVAVLYDPDDDESYPWYTHQFTVSDSLSTDEANSTYCGERLFEVVAKTTLGESMLSDDCTSCLTLTQDGYTATLRVRIQDASFSTLSIDFTFNVYIAELHSYSVKGEPTASHDFTIQVLEYNPACVVDSATLQQDTEAFNYTIGSIIEPVVYKLVRNPQCDTEGTLSVQVEDLTVASEILDKYGIYFQEETDEDGNFTLIELYVQYYASDLAEQSVVVEIEYSIGDENWLFEPTEVLYLPQAEEEERETDPFALEVSLSIPDVISLEFVDWFYELPRAVDSTITCKFEAPEDLAYLLVYYEDSNSVSASGDTLPDDGSYVGKYILTTTDGETQEFEIAFEVKAYLDSEDDEEFGEDDWGYFEGVNIDDFEDEEVPVPPVPTIDKITSTGVITIEWSEHMQQLTESDILNHQRKLQDQILSSENSDLLSVELIQRSDLDEVDSTALDFTYSFQWKDSLTSELSLDINQPEYVSYKGQRDLLLIAFNDTSVFKSVEGLPIETNFKIYHEIPKQLPKEGAVQVNVQSLKTASLATLSVGLVASFFLSALLNQLLSIIENLGLIAHMFILTISYPTNTQEFFSALFPIVTFDMFPTKDLFQWIFYFDDLISYPISDQFWMVGYEQTMIIQSLGSLYLVSVLQPALTIVLALMNCCLPVWRCLPWCKKRIQPRVDNYFKTFFWNGLITFIDSGYLVFCITSMIGVVDLRFSPVFSKSEWFNSFTAVQILVVCFLFPIVLTMLYCCKIKSCDPKPELHDFMTLEELQATYGTLDVQKIKRTIYTNTQHKQFLEKYGCLIEGIRMQKLGKSLAIFAAILPTVRKLMFVSAIMIFITQPMWTIVIFNFSTLFYVIFIDFYQVYDCKWKHRLHVMNEYVILGSVYHLFCFTEWTNMEQQQWAGNAIIYFVCIETSIFFVIAAIPVVQDLQLKCRKRFLRKQAKKRLKQIAMEKEQLQNKAYPEDSFNAAPSEKHNDQTMQKSQDIGPIDDHVFKKPKTVVDMVQQHRNKEILNQTDQQMISVIEQRLASIESVDEAASDDDGDSGKRAQEQRMTLYEKMQLDQPGLDSLVREVQESSADKSHEWNGLIR